MVLKAIIQRKGCLIRTKMRGVIVYLVLSSLLVSTGLSLTTIPTNCSQNNPQDQDAAGSARRLVAHSSWGVLNTLAYDKRGAPFGNVVVFSDGGTGTPYFYLTFKDNTTVNYSLRDQRSSFTVSQYALGPCHHNNPQIPTCARVTLTGKLILLEEDSEESELAKAVLFTRHPELKVLPKRLKFSSFKLEVESIFIINTFQGPRFPSLDEYRRAKV